ncbi:hypothetical protein H8356DRAFT_1280889 [Neocallimastix lanati (nom. inval.)]|nr:hypothetical protein H8356DRAFT_1280889 [Neocallimastix sp. JGI-2020a]
MKILSSVFENNYGINGGVIYFGQSNNHLNKNTIELVDLIFNKNRAEYFGGVIFSDYEYLNFQNIRNVTFTENHAYAGGVVYIDNENSKNDENNIENKFIFMENKNFKYIHNTAESHGNNYATDPYMTDLLKSDINNFVIKSGDSFPLKFNLTDEFNQIIKDESKLYSNMGLKISIANEDNNKYKLNGNMCFFSNGICDLNNFKIFSTDPGNVKLKISLEHENNKVILTNKEINVKLEKCDKEQIKITDKHNFYSCENPICEESCPILNGTAECIKGYKENINSIELNQCKCLPGWEEINCDKRVFVKYNYLNKKIIEDTGFSKCELVLFGLLFVLISLNFNPFKNYNSCVLEFIFKHSGIILIYMIFTFYIKTARKLGLNLINYTGSNTLPFTSESFKDNSIIRSSSNQINQEIESKTTDENDVSSVSQSVAKKINKRILLLHSLALEFCIIYIALWVFLIITTFILKNKETKYKQEYNYNWRYECPLRTLSLGMTAIESVLILYLVLSTRKIWKYTYIFKCTRYISYACMIWTTLGPLIDLISNLTIQNKSNIILGFCITTNSICYLMIFFLFIWEKVYYILRQEDNNTHNYFIAEKLEKCIIHRSFSCECNKNYSEESDEIVSKYLDFYKYCTQIFLFKNGNLKYVNKGSKNTLKFIV